jgi:hypothetical protein
MQLLMMAKLLRASRAGETDSVGKPMGRKSPEKPSLEKKTRRRKVPEKF